MVNEEQLRQEFEKLNRDSYGFRRSRRGSYINPVIQRDWKWFKLGAQAFRSVTGKVELSGAKSLTTPG